MTDRTIELDRHRGMSAQKATDLRRLLAEVDADAKALRSRQEALEKQLIAAPAATWPEAAEKWPTAKDWCPETRQPLTRQHHGTVGL